MALPYGLKPTLQDLPKSENNPILSKMCIPCNITRVNILRHVKHGGWVDLRLSAHYYSHLNLSQKRRFLIQMCDVCPCHALLTCMECPLMLCTSCQVVLERTYNGNLEGLLRHHDREGIKDDAFLLSRRPLDEVGCPPASDVVYNHTTVDDHFDAVETLREFYWNEPESEGQLNEDAWRLA